MYYLYYKKNNEIEYKAYGFGNLNYMSELINDYILTHKMYDNKTIEFKIVNIKEIKDE